MTWVYVSATILLFGAHLTSRYASFPIRIREERGLKLLWTGLARVRLRVVAMPVRVGNSSLPPFACRLCALVLSVAMFACGNSEDPLSGAIVEPVEASTDTPVPPAAPTVDPLPASQAISGNLPALPNLSSRTDLGSLPSLAELVEQVRPAVASIAIESVARGLFFDFTDEGAGTGIVVRSDGYVVTNSHVVEAADSIIVSLANGESYPARIVGTDKLTDIAVIKIDAEGLTASDLWRLGHASGRRLGAGAWERPGAQGWAFSHPRHSQRTGPYGGDGSVGRPVRHDPDRRGDQRREQRWTSGESGRRGDRHQHGDHAPGAGNRVHRQLQRGPCPSSRV